MLKTEDVFLMGNAPYEKYPDFLITTLVSGLRARAIPTFDGNPDEMFSMLCDKNQGIERNVQLKLTLAFTDVLSDYLTEFCGIPQNIVKDPSNFLRYSVFDLESIFPNKDVPKVPALNWPQIISYANACKNNEPPCSLKTVKPWYNDQPSKASKYSVVFKEVPKQNYDIYIVSSLFSAYSIYVKDAGKDTNGKSLINIYGADNQPIQKTAFFSTINMIEQKIANYLILEGFSDNESQKMVSDCGLDVSAYLSPKYPQIQDPLPIDWLEIAEYSRSIVEKEQEDVEVNLEI